VDKRTFTTLELPSLVDLLARHVSSPLGRKKALALLPSTNLEGINEDLDRTTECANFLSTGGGFGIAEITDPEPALHQLSIEGTSLEPKQVLELQRVISVGEDLRNLFNDPEARARYPGLAAICRSIADLRRALAAIRGKILPNGEIDDNASPELRRIRREINDRRSRIYRNLESLMRDRAQPAIQDEVVTVRNGRFVIPVRTDSRGQVPGVMHGLSSSGQTTYIEPLTIIDQNNELVRLREEEEIEIAQILFLISESLRDNLPLIDGAVAAISEIDFVQAKARLSAEFNCARPEMNKARCILLEDARHPLLERALRNSEGKVVPISLEMDEEHQTLVVSGPNAGGKTVVTKTVGLLALMAQMGLHLPTKRAVLPVFELVLADIGDQQSIAANLSTFTAHMKNIAEMARAVSAGSGSAHNGAVLILIDEVGTGTDPDEGAALGIAIVDYFRRAGATTVATTHYNPLKVWAAQTADVLNASVEFDEATLRPTYRLITGVAGASSGIEIARRMEVPSEIISGAGAHLDPAQHETSNYLKQLKTLVDQRSALVAALEEERQATADKYAGLDIEFAKREAQRSRQFENELTAVVQDFKVESSKIIESINDKATASRLRKEAESRASNLRRSAAVRIRKQVASAPGLDPQLGEAASPISEETEGTSAAAGAADLCEAAEDIHERDRVRVKSLAREGEVESISGEEYTVLVGALRFRARRNEIELLSRAEKPASKRAASLPRGVSADLGPSGDFTPEINLIGSNADEATDRTDKFLDEAFLAGVETVRIIHGHGKGALRKAVSELLRGHPHIESFGQAPPNEGGAGATVAVLKK